MDKGKIVENRLVTGSLYSMTIETDECNFRGPGQYAEIKLTDSDCEKAYPVSEFDSKRFTIFYKDDNACAHQMSTMDVGNELYVETGLGDGFIVEDIPDGVILVADTYGVAQMLGLMRSLLISGKTCRLVLGFSTKDRVYMTETFSNLCSNIEIFTEDGSNGRQGCAADGVRNAEYVCAAGSIGMLDKLNGKAQHGQYNDGMNITVW